MMPFCLARFNARILSTMLAAPSLRFSPPTGIRLPPASFPDIESNTSWIPGSVAAVSKKRPGSTHTLYWQKSRGHRCEFLSSCQEVQGRESFSQYQGPLVLAEHFLTILGILT